MARLRKGLRMSDKSITQLIFEHLPGTLDEIVQGVTWFRPKVKRKSVIDALKRMEKDCLLVKWTDGSGYARYD